ncbi:hypothetical protein MTO96_014574 [Rhipicephalus appendiculatus]
MATRSLYELVCLRTLSGHADDDGSPSVVASSSRRILRQRPLVRSAGPSGQRTLSNDRKSSKYNAWRRLEMKQFDCFALFLSSSLSPTFLSLGSLSPPTAPTFECPADEDGTSCKPAAMIRAKRFVFIRGLQFLLLLD